MILLGLTTAAAAVDARIHKKFAETRIATLIISNKKMKDIMKIVKWCLEESSLLIKGATKQMKMKEMNEKMDFLVCY